MVQPGHTLRCGIWRGRRDELFLKEVPDQLSLASLGPWSARLEQPALYLSVPILQRVCNRVVVTLPIFPELPLPLAWSARHPCQGPPPPSSVARTVQLQPELAPQVSHLAQAPERTRVSWPHSEQGSPS